MQEGASGPTEVISNGTCRTTNGGSDDCTEDRTVLFIVSQITRCPQPSTHPFSGSPCSGLPGGTPGDVDLHTFSRSRRSPVYCAVLSKSPFLRRWLEAHPASEVLEICVKEGSGCCFSVEAVWLVIEQLSDPSRYQQISLDEACPCVNSSEVYAVCRQLELLGDVWLERLLGDMDLRSLPMACCLAYRYEDPRLLARCYWELKELVCTHSLPPDWTDISQCTAQVADAGSVFTPVGTKLIFGTPVAALPLSSGAEGYLKCPGRARLPLKCFQCVLDHDRLDKMDLSNPPQGYLLCRLERQRGDRGAYPHRYKLVLDHTGEILLTGIKKDQHGPARLYKFRKNNQQWQEGGRPASVFGPNYVGCVEESFWGTLFELMDDGLAPGLVKAPGVAGLPHTVRKSLAKIRFNTNFLGDAPRQMTVSMRREGTTYEMENMSPRWDSSLNSYALPFYGRVKLASAKNFQLVKKRETGVAEDSEEEIYLMFGKISKDIYSLDFRHPLSQLDAIAIALGALAKKRAVA
eukprot:GHVS01095563.1.p1 GENE.GHVS01095563.1~~GHVS01095563.1.p1  ORF type:complete len:519 (+),score=45.95 GHVS01095563.1:152-1708(+)